MISTPRRGRAGTPSFKQPAPAYTVKHFVTLWVVLAASSLPAMWLLGVPLEYGATSAYYITILAALYPPSNWVYSAFKSGVFSNQMIKCSDTLMLLYGAAVGVAVVSTIEQFTKVGIWYALATIFVSAVLFRSVVVVLTGKRIRQSKSPTAAGSTATPAGQSVTATPSPPPPFALRVGWSTGHLASLRHGAGMAAGQLVTLDLESAATNVIAFGGTGSGKTTRLISPLLLETLRQDAGILIFDIKTDFIREVSYLAAGTHRKIDVIGDGGLPFNLLEGLTPEVAASFLKSAFLVAEGSKASSHAFWVDGAVELCRNALGLLQFFPARYTLTELNRFIFDIETQTEVIELIEDLQAEGQIGAEHERAIEANRFYFSKIWANKEDKEKSYLQSTCAQVLSPFTNPALIDAFCTVRPAGQQARFEDLVNAGVAYLVELPITRYGKEGARIAYLFLKLRFMQVMRERRMRPDWNQSRPVVFMCDEYQAIVDQISDTDFWDKSRASKTIGIVSMQGYSSMIDAVGSEQVAATIAQNFRQVICFRTEDENTIKRLTFLLGQVDVPYVSESQGHGSNNNGLLGRGSSTSQNDGRSISWQRQAVINPQLFRQLGQDQALAILNIKGVAFDDVITCAKVFVPEGWRP